MNRVSSEGVLCHGRWHAERQIQISVFVPKYLKMKMAVSINLHRLDPSRSPNTRQDP